MNIFIQKLSDSLSVHTVDVNPDDTVFQVKQKYLLVEPSAFDIKLLKLFFNGAELHNDTTLEANGINRDAYVRVTLNERHPTWEDNSQEIIKSFKPISQEDECKSIPLNAINLRRLFLFFVQRVFSTPANYGTYRAYMHDKIWSSDPDKRLISVQLAHDFDATQIYNMLPSVFVSIGEQTFDTDNLVRSSAGFNSDNSAETFILQGRTILGVCCYADTYDFAAALAEIVLVNLTGYRQWLVDNYDLRYFNIKQISQPKLIKAQEDAQLSYYRVDIFSELSYNHAVNFNTESLRLKKFDFNTDYEIGVAMPIDLKSIS
jgi:hypothetical protein